MDPPQVTYTQQPITVFQATESCRHLGYWATPNGDMTKTKRRVLAKTREVLGLLTHHPLETKTAKELFQSMAVSVFRYSAAQERWSQAELDQLQSLWTQAYKRAEYLPNGTASDIFVSPKNWESLPSSFLKCVFITAGPITKLFAGGGGGEWTTCAMIDDEPTAEACVDESAHHALGPVRNPVL